MLAPQRVSQALKTPLEQLSGSTFPSALDFPGMGNVCKLGEGSVMIWIKSSDSERGQLWDHPGSLHAMHLKHLFFLSSEPCLTSLSFFLFPSVYSSFLSRGKGAIYRHRESMNRGENPTAFPMSLVITSWAGHLPCSVLWGLFVPYLGSGNARGMCQVENELPPGQPTCVPPRC